MAAPNGGLGQIEVSIELALMDRLRTARLEAFGLDLNAINSNLYPKAYTRANCVKYIMINPRLYKDGDYKLWWDGTLDWTVENATIVSSAANYKILRPTTDLVKNMNIILKSLSVAPTYIHCVHVDEEAAFLGGEYLGGSFLSDMAYLKPGRIRFMNDAGGSGTTILRAEHLNVEADLTWSGETYHYSANKIATAVKDPNTAVDEYDCTVPSWTGDDGDTFWLPLDASLVSTNGFTNSTSTTNAMKISVNGGPRKQVRIHNSYDTFIFGVQHFQASAGRYANVRVRYDEAFDCYVIRGGGNENPWGGGDNGHTPFSIMAKIATRVGADLHCSLPAQAADRGGTAIAAACAEIDANLGPGLKAIIEIGNEIWNTARGFWNTSYATKKAALKYGAGAGFDDGYGRMLAVAAPIIHAAFGGNKNRYQLAAGIKTFSTIGATGTNRISAAKSVSVEGLASPKSLIDETLMATYYNPDGLPQGIPNQKTTDPRWIASIYWAKKYRDAVAAGDTVTAAKARRFVVDSALRERIDANNLPLQTCKAKIESNATALMNAYPGMKIAFYEGGYSSQVATGEPNLNVTGTDPEGVTVTYSGAQPVGTKAMYNELVKAGRFDDPKLQWIAFQWYRYWHDKPNFRFPSRYGYGPSGTFGDWAAKGSDSVQFDQDAKGFAAFSNGDSIMLASCA